MERPSQQFRLSDLPMYLGYGVSVVTFAAGAVIAGGWLLERGVPPQFRIMFGVVFMLMGVYRFVLTRSKIRQWKSEDDIDEH